MSALADAAEPWLSLHCHASLKCADSGGFPVLSVNTYLHELRHFSLVTISNCLGTKGDILNTRKKASPVKQISLNELSFQKKGKISRWTN